MTIKSKFIVNSEDELLMSKKSLWFITIITAMYLIVELAFQSRLLDVAGTMVSIHEVEALEKFGRLISGTAVYLVFLGMVILPQARKRRFLKNIPCRLAISFISAVVIISSVFFGEKFAVDYLVNKSTGIERRAAAQASMIQNALLKDVIILDGMQISNKALQSPEGKSFVAVLPFLGFTIVSKKLTASELKSIVRKIVKAKIGNGNQFLKNKVHTQLRKIESAYKNHYVPATNSYRKALSPKVIAAESEKAWTGYLHRVSTQKFTPKTIPVSKYADVRKKLRNRGIMVSESWKPYDKKGFLDAAKTAYYKKAFENKPKAFDKIWQEYMSGLKQYSITFGNISRSYYPRIRAALRKKGLKVPDTWNPNDKIGFYKAFDKTYKSRVKKRYSVEAEKYWKEYKATLASYPLTPEEIPESLWPKIRREMKKSGLDLPDTWKPWDKNVFIESYKQVYGKKVAKKFRQEAGKFLGFYPKHFSPGLSYKEFLDNKDIKRYLGDRRKYIGKSNREILARIIQSNSLEAYRKITGKAKDYENGGKYEEVGKTAMRSVIVPPFALFLSLLGGFVHIFKTSNFMLSFKFTSRFRLPFFIIVAISLIVLLHKIDLTNQITGSRLYASLDSQITSVYGSAMSSGVRTLIETAPFVYPVNSALRKTCLRGWNFDRMPDGKFYSQMLKSNILGQ